MKQQQPDGAAKAMAALIEQYGLTLGVTEDWSGGPLVDEDRREELANYRVHLRAVDPATRLTRGGFAWTYRYRDEALPTLEEVLKEVGGACLHLDTSVDLFDYLCGHEVIGDCAADARRQYAEDRETRQQIKALLGPAGYAALLTISQADRAARDAVRHDPSRGADRLNRSSSSVPALDPPVI